MNISSDLGKMAYRAYLGFFCRGAEGEGEARVVKASTEGA
jgi:hypothetical protein